VPEEAIVSDATPCGESICDRLTAVRQSLFGPRGRAAFARALDLSPTTYIYYEKGRTPPPEVLARAAELAGVTLEWLVTGSGPQQKTVADVRRQWSDRLPPDLQRSLDRFIEQGGAQGSSPAALGALGEILDTVNVRFAGSDAPAWDTSAIENARGMIPILGRTAAGLVGSYEDLLGEAPAVSVADLAERALGLDVRSRSADTVASDDPTMARALADLPAAVSLVQLAEPLPSGVVEFVDAPSVRGKFPEAFALRVDGESMSPRFRHGDVVIAAPGRAVRQGQAALVQIRERVGITLKLVRRDDEAVHLIPINETYDTERLATAEIEWEAPVLLAVRFGSRA
jgi:transcriptional regulator with XRE-family HTH domain